MSKPDANKAGLLSPYLSLRETVRPAIFAYTLMAYEKERAGALAEECNNLLQTSRDLLRTAALVHILSPEPGHENFHGASDDKQAELLDAYADAGMLWAKVIGSYMALADLLLQQQRWDEVRHIATLIEDAGEGETAKTLRSQADNALWKKHHEGLKEINAKMRQAEIRKAIKALSDALMEIPQDFSEGIYKVNLLLIPLAVSIEKMDPHFNTYLYEVEQGCHMKDPAQETLLRLAAEFERNSK